MYTDYSAKLATLIVNYSVQVQPGDKVFIRAPTNAEELLREIYREVIKAGGNILQINLSFDGQDELLYSYGLDEQITYVSPLEIEAYKTADKMIVIFSSFNTRALTNISPEKKNKKN